jgi:septal ring factor EnvC (AmiA/AmiB activator)
MYRYVILIWLVLSAIQSAARAEQRELAVLPNESDYTARESGEHCSVLRAVLRRAESEHDETARARAGSKQVLRQSREDLEACAHREGASLSRDPRSQALLAEVCAVEYDNWLYAGAHYRMLREDSDEANGSMQLLVAHARGRCQALPTRPSAQDVATNEPGVEQRSFLDKRAAYPPR